MQRNNKIKIKPIRKQPLERVELLVEMSNGGFFKDPNDPTIVEMISAIAQFQSIPFGTVAKWTFDSIQDVFMKIVGIVNDYKFKEPPRTITANGVTYELITEPRKESGGWWNHLSMLKAHTTPAAFLGLVYIEKNRHYAETDDRGNIITTTTERGEKLAEEFNAGMFIDLMGFFLSKYEGALKLISIHNNPKAKIILKKGRNPFNGKTL